MTTKAEIEEEVQLLKKQLKNAERRIIAGQQKLEQRTIEQVGQAEKSLYETGLLIQHLSIATDYVCGVRDLCIDSHKNDSPLCSHSCELLSNRACEYLWEVISAQEGRKMKLEGLEGLKD